MADAIKKFWTWWPSIRPRIEAAIDGKAEFDEALVKEINDRVTAIREGLDWELAPGLTAKHAFCLSAKGDPEGRLVTETWRARGPAADATWEFHGSRRGGPHRASMELQIDGKSVKLDEFTVALEVDPARERIHGTYFHPAFPTMADEQLRFTATYLILDGTLGEDEVERWLGVIETSMRPLSDAQPMASLLAAVDELRKTATGERFVVYQGQDDGGAPAMASVNQALKRIDHLLACMHVTVDIGLATPKPDGLATQDEAAQLDAMEDELAKALGADAVYYGRETRRGRRVLHYFAPEDGPAGGAIERWTKAHAGRDIATTWKRDPTWEAQRRFT